jgi:mono/diheme cytochrome c family protein
VSSAAQTPGSDDDTPRPPGRNQARAALAVALLAIVGAGALLLAGRGAPVAAGAATDATTLQPGAATATTPAPSTTPAAISPAATAGTVTPVVVAVAAPTSGGTPAPATPDKPADEKLEPGLTFGVTSAAGGAADLRTARLAALYVPDQESASPFIAPGPFTATWEGYITKDIWEKTTFSAEGSGALTVTLNDKAVLTCPGPDLAGPTGTIRVDKGRTRLRITYTAPATGVARARLFWETRDIPREPVPPTVFVHNVADKPFKAALKQHHGLAQLGALRCTKCHQSDASAAAGGLPELATDAPDLREAGGQFNAAWMARWIADPQAVRPGAAMPRLLHGADAPQAAADIAAFLATLGKAADFTASDEQRIAGGYTFTKLGCVACHAPAGDTPAHISLAGVKAKWQPAALAEFLKQPNKHYAWIRMPTFGFTDDEAKQLAAFVLARADKDAEKDGKTLAGDAARGKALVASSGCAGCHQLGDGFAAPPAPKLADLAGKTAGGCLATGGDEVARGKAPEFTLSGPDISGLRAILATDLAALKRRSLPEFAERRFAALRCIACHTRDNAEALLTDYKPEADKILADLPPKPDAANTDGATGAFEQPRPLLTFIGDKLRPEWAAKFIAGELKWRPRPWLQMRMPAFPAAADLLAQGFSLEHGLPPVTPADPVVSDPPASFGKDLTGPNGGFNCSGCHGIGSAAPTAVFEAPGVNLGYATQRLQKDYYHRWLRAPLRFDPLTRMPQFSTDGTTPIANILDGKAKDQFESIWGYLVEVAKGTDYVH